MEDDTTLCSPIGLVSVGISPDVTPAGDSVAVLDAEHVEGKVVDLIASKRIKKNLQK